PLDVQVRSFSIKGASLAEVQHLIMNLPEIRKWMKANGIRAFDLESPSLQRVPKMRLSLNLNGGSLLQILDAVAWASGKMSWRIVWFDHDKLMGIYF
ncbi:MAG: hypothetical protein ACRD4O_10565, partial [Bryobacteraceae bacterium]